MCHPPWVTGSSWGEHLEPPGWIRELVGRVLAFQAVSGTEELLDVVQEEGLQVVQVAVKVEQVVVQAEVVLAWGVLVSEMEEQTVEGLAAGKLQTCHQRFLLMLFL